MSSITLAPILPVAALMGLAIVIALIALTSILKANRGLWMRLAACILLLIGLFNPQIITKDTESLSDIALVVVDRSSSQDTDDRNAQIEEAVAHLQKEGELYHDLEIRTVEITPDGQEDKFGTRALGAVRHAMAGIDKNRFAGSVLISDGQIHDLEEAKTITQPLHVFLTGQNDEKDRRLEVLDAPRYGLIGEKLTIKVQILDNGQPNTTADLRLIHPDGTQQIIAGNGKAVRTLSFTPEHAGESVLVLQADALEDEISLTNNQTALTINGIRDRLRVLLVSGLPHQGQRTWRNILRSDPSVDLVHFTILRPSEKEDFTPLNELSLIAFPVRELFEEKLEDFDLIIFDRYYKHNVLSEGYFDNIVDYVRGGGAIFISAGPDFSGPRSLAKTRLRKLLPLQPSGQIIDDRPFQLSRSELGKRHPITDNLGLAEKEWGRWARYVEITDNSAQILMETEDKKPLLVVDRIEKGRIAILLSDHIWLWARGFDGGGPHSALVRHLVHWLMKEPDLEEERLSMTLRDGRTLEINRRSLKAPQAPLTLTKPNGEQQQITLKKSKEGLYQTSITTEAPGIYRAEDNQLQAVIGVGALNPKEFIDTRATDRYVSTLTDSIHWLNKGLPHLKRTAAKSTQHGKGWFGLKQNHAEAIIGIKHTSVLPLWAMFILTLGLWTLAWWREGR